jgi:hypothetical protein
MPLPEENIQWLLAAAQWLLAGPDAGLFKGRRLVRFEAEEFFDSDLSDDDLAARILDLTKKQAGLSLTATQLARVDSPVRGLSESLGGAWLDNLGASCPDEDALEGEGDDEAVVIWTADLLEDPDRLVAWFARELGRIVVKRAGSDPPGADTGAPVRELAAEVAAVLMGFGPFLIKTSFRLEMFPPNDPNALVGLGLFSGWKTVVQGCLGREDLAYLLAVFCRINNVPEAEIMPWLGENARAHLAEAAADLDRRDDFLARLRKLF